MGNIVYNLDKFWKWRIGMIYKKVLRNRITLVMEELPYYRSVSVGVWVRAGSMYETEANNGMAHVIEHMLFKGTKRRSAEMLADEMTALGGNMDAFTCKDCTCYYAKTLDIHLEKVMDLLSDMLLHSRFDGEELKKELGVILDEIDLYEDSPEDLVHEHLQMEVWKDHPLGYLISGDKAVVGHFTREDVLTFFRKFYVGSNMVISIAGHFDRDQAEELAEKYFGELQSGERAQIPEPPIFTPCLWLKEKDMEQNHMTLAFDCCTNISEERYVLTVVNSLLGGNMNSRLFMKIRDLMGLTYSIYSYGSSYETAGLFQIYAAMSPEAAGKVVEEIFREVDRLKAEGFTSRELTVAKAQIQTELIIDSESTYSRMSANGKNSLIFGHVIPLEEELKRIGSVSLEDTQSFVCKYLDKRHCAMSMVGQTRIVDGTFRRKIWGGEV